MVRRSVLFSPGDQPELLYKAPETGADTVVFDLEDAVAPANKAAARDAIADVLADRSFDPDCEVCVRVNSDPAVASDDVAVTVAGDRLPDAVVIPKVESADDVSTVAGLLDDLGASDLPIVALCESAAGVLQAEAIAASDPVVAVAFGAEDLAADLGASRTPDGTEVLYAREHVVLAAAAAGVEAIDTVYTDVEDTDGLGEETAFALELGYDGKMCVHPAQVPVVNEAFTPAPDRVEWARRVLDAAAEAGADDVGVFRVDGEMIDAPLVARAEQVRERARAAGIW